MSLDDARVKMEACGTFRNEKRHHNEIERKDLSPYQFASGLA